MDFNGAEHCALCEPGPFCFYCGHYLKGNVHDPKESFVVEEQACCADCYDEFKQEMGVLFNEAYCNSNGKV